MPQAAYTECRKPLCRNYAVKGGYCHEHRGGFDRPEHIERVAGLQTGARFRRLRHSFLVRNPLCVVCGEVATVLDHIVPHRGDLDRFWSQDNWQGLCVRCHGRKTAREMFHR